MTATSHERRSRECGKVSIIHRVHFANGHAALYRQKHRRLSCRSTSIVCSLSIRRKHILALAPGFQLAPCLLS